MKKIPIQYYQMVLMDQAFFRRDIPVDTLSWYMHSILPQKYSADQEAGSKREPLDKEQLKKEVIIGGSSAFEALIDAAEKAGLSELVGYLTDHNVKQLYRYVWIWSEDNSIMRRGKSWFTSRSDCLAEGKRNSPSYTTFDGPGCPMAQLSVEAVCPCFVHLTDSITDTIAQPCLCFTPNIPDQMKDKCEITMNGLTFVKAPVTNFSGCPKYEYVIKESGTVFTSYEKDIYLAYLEWRRRSINSTASSHFY